MSQTVDHIILYLERLAPVNTALEWDNSGLLIGERDKPVKRILVALDCTDEIVDEAERLEANLIITHHPLIFHPINTVTTDTALGRRIIKLIRSHVSLYSAHTNLDIAEGGTNDALFSTIGLTDKKPLMPPDSEDAGLGCTGILRAPMRLDELAAYVGQKLGLKHTRYAGSPAITVNKVGLMCGSGSGFKYFKQAAANGCQAYITGDIKYHDTQAALEMGLCLIDATHYASEVPIVERLCGYLREGFPDLNIYAAEFDKKMEGLFEYNN